MTQSKPYTANFQALMKGETPAWIPFTLDVGAIPGMTQPVRRTFEKETGESDPAEYFDYDFRTFSLSARFGGDDPARLHGEVEPGTSFDEWGIGHWAGGAEGTYEKSLGPLEHAQSVADVEALPTPVIGTDTDVAAIAAYRRRGYPVFGYAGSLYEWSWWLRGMTNFLEDLIDRPAIAEAIIRKVACYTQKLALASARAGIDVLCFYDDVGMQTGMQISPALWRKYIKPRWREILEAVRNEAPRTYCFLHNCGNIMPIVDDIVELGFHILHPLQPECMDVAAVKKNFGRHITLCATLSAQRVFPFGTPQEVKAEVRRMKAAYGEDRRCILCPSNRIQPETPWRNILAFATEAKAGR